MERQISIRHGQEELTATIHYPVVKDIKEEKLSNESLWRSSATALLVAGSAWIVCL